MRTGRPAVPTALRKLRGNPGKRPLPKNEPRPPEIKVAAPPPEWLTDHSRAEWYRLEPVIRRMRVLTEADLGALAMLCSAFGEYREALEEIAAAGRFVEQAVPGGGHRISAHPAVKVASDSWRRYLVACSHFGLTPSSRTKVQAAPQESAEQGLEALLGGDDGAEAEAN